VLNTDLFANNPSAACSRGASNANSVGDGRRVFADRLP
jgi:hypothetical protein